MDGDINEPAFHLGRAVNSMNQADNALQQAILALREWRTQGGGDARWKTSHIEKTLLGALQSTQIAAAHFTAVALCEDLGDAGHYPETEG